jgi:hypothetical protein
LGRWLTMLGGLIGRHVPTLLLFGAAFTFFPQVAHAETQIHLKDTVWGCFDPNVTPIINDPTNPNHWDPQWIAQTSKDGQCGLITPQSIWATLSSDYNGMTYVTRRGTVGPLGSFWVPTTAIDVTSEIQVVSPQPLPAKAKEPPPSTPAPVPETANSAQNPTPAAADQSDTTVPASAPSDTSTNDGGSGFGAFAGFLLLAAIWYLLRSRRQKTKSVGRVKPIAAQTSIQNATPGIQRFSPIITDSRSTPSDRTSITPSAGKSALVWHPSGNAVSIAGLTITCGMVYVGQASGSMDSNEASFIDPTLSVARSSALAGPLGYWPAYRSLTPECRRAYLEWLASGKQAPGQDIGYVFLFFYGLERRLLVERPTGEEVRIIVVEIERLRSIYTENHSFNGYSNRLLEAIAFLQASSETSPTPFVPDLNVASLEMPLSLKVAIAREVVAGRALSFDLAAAGLFGLRDFWSAHRYILGSGRGVFLTVLLSRFETAFPSGFSLRNRKDSRLQLIYRGASAGLQVNLAQRAGIKDLPDPVALTWTKLLNLAGTVAEEVTPYAKMLTYYPARANSLFGLVGCPTELRTVVAPGPRQWLEGLPALAAIPFGELAGHAIGISTAKWRIHHRRQISEALALTGYAMEPGPEESSERLEDSTCVQIFRCADPTVSRVTYVTCTAAMFVAIIAKTLDDDSEKIFTSWQSKIPPRFSLTSDQTMRLRARFAWLVSRPVTLVRAKRLVADATPQEKEFCAWSATMAAIAANSVNKPQVAILEAIYDTLNISRNELYAELHKGIGATAISADSPILVSEEAQEALHPIPRPPATDRPDNKPDRLAQIRAETERVAAMLEEVFADDDLQATTVEPVSDGPLAGLDREHTVLVTQLLTRSNWPRATFDSAVSEVGLMPSGAMETINEWAFDHFGDALLEDGDPIVVNRTLVPVDPEAVPAE